MKITRVLARNPGPFTGPGTNTWLLESEGKAVIIDPGPVDADHADTILARLGDGTDVVGVVVTHTHLDHAPLANPLAGEIGVPAYGHAAGPEFDPDLMLHDGSSLVVGEVVIDVVHTPGHADDHLCFLAGRSLFTGDHIMGGSSVVVEKMTPYLASLERLKGLDLGSLYPGHGEVMDEPSAVIDWYLAHRRQREQEILDAVRSGADTVADVVEVVYRDVDPALHPLAARSVRAHLDKLAADDLVVLDGSGIGLKSEVHR